MFKHQSKPTHITMHLKRHTFLFVLFLSSYSRSHAQHQENILPLGLNHKIYEQLRVIQLPPVDSMVIKSRNAKLTKELFVAYSFKTDFSPRKNDAGWGIYAKDYKSWHLKLQSKGAYGIGIVFSKVKLLPGEKLFIYNLRGMNGSYDEHTIPESGVLPIDFLKGDEVVIEFDTPIESTERGTFTIDAVSHAYRDLFRPTQSNSGADKTQRRNAIANDTDCYVCMEGDTLQQIKRSVVKLTIFMDDGAKVCTGTLINNTAQDKNPYVITAQHCISSEAEAARTVFTFNFDYNSCAESSSIIAYNQVLNGSSYLASRYENDFSIVKMNEYPPLDYHPYYAGWDITDNERGHVMSIHHPEGGPKKMSIFQSAVVPHNFDDQTPRASNGFWQISKWDAGATEGGSSGGPLFSKDRLIMGTLTGGSSTCGSPYNDYYQRLSQSWEPSGSINQQLKHWLDPISSGKKFMKGIDPFKGITVVCDTLSNIQPEGAFDLIPYTSGVGYFSGYNSDNIASYAEKFYSSDSIMLTGSLFWIGSLNASSPGGITVTVHQNDQGLPGAALFQTYVPYNQLDSGLSNYISFYPFVNIKGTFFISYTLSYSPSDKFALFQSSWRDNVESTAFVKIPMGWASIKAISPAGKGASFGIEAFACHRESNVTPTPDTPLFSVYPNPSSSVVIIKFKELTLHELSLQLFDLQGGMHPVSFYHSDNNIVINTIELTSGMYILRFRVNGTLQQAKFLKFK